MTNEEFIQELRDVEYLMPEAVLPYARKLVALSEAANAVYSSAAQTTPDSIWEVDDEEMQWPRRALKELQRGKE